MSEQVYRAAGRRVMLGKRVVAVDAKTNGDAAIIADAMNFYCGAVDALAPFVEAANRVDEYKAMSKRLGLAVCSDDTNHCLGITFQHLYAAREVMVKAHGRE